MKKKQLNIKSELEGPSDEIQIFKFIMLDGEVKFKWSNIYELGKSFEEKKEDYLLVIENTSN